MPTPPATSEPRCWRSRPTSSSPARAARPERCAAADFFEGLFTTAIGEGELLTEVRIRKHTGWGAHYEKFVRVSHQWSIVGVAATVQAAGGTITQARIGLTNMGSTPLRATSVEAALVGQPATDDAVRAAAATAADGTDPP